MAATKSNASRSERPSKEGRANSLQKLQRATTRQTIINAARALFVESSYSETSIEAIAQKAGISRSSFYRHFTDKWSVAKAMYEGMMPTLVQVHWRVLAGLKDPTPEDLEAWLRNMLNDLKQDVPLLKVLREIESIEPECFDFSLAVKDQILDVLERGRLSSHDGARTARSEDRYFALLFLFQIDQFMFMVLARGWRSKDNALIHAMARHLHAFLHNRDSAA